MVGFVVCLSSRCWFFSAAQLVAPQFPDQRLNPGPGSGSTDA